MQLEPSALLSNGLIQQIPVACILVFAMHRFLQHLEKRDKTLGDSLERFATSVNHMTGEVARLGHAVTKLDQHRRTQPRAED